MNQNLFDDMFGANGANTKLKQEREEQEAEQAQVNDSLDVKVYIDKQPATVTVSGEEVSKILENRPSFVLYRDWEAYLEPLKPEQVKKWIKALFQFADSGSYITTGDPIVDVCLIPCINQMRRDLHKYVTKSVQNKINREQKEQNDAE